jgi:hypothetical protein
MYELIIHDEGFSVVFNARGITLEQVKKELCETFGKRKMGFMVNQEAGEALVYVDGKWMATVRVEIEEKNITLTK